MRARSIRTLRSSRRRWSPWRPSELRDHTGAALACDRTPQARHRARVFDARIGQVEHQRADAGRLFPPALARVAHSAAVHRDRHARRVRREGARGGWRADRPSRRDAAGDRPRAGVGGRQTSQETERAGPPDARSARRGAEEAGPGWRAEALPVQQAVNDQILTPLDLALGPFGVEREMRAAAETTQGKG